MGWKKKTSDIEAQLQQTWMSQVTYSRKRARHGTVECHPHDMFDKYPFEKEWNIYSISNDLAKHNTSVISAHDGAFDSICYLCFRHLRIQFIVGK